MKNKKSSKDIIIVVLVFLVMVSIILTIYPRINYLNYVSCNEIIKFSGFTTEMSREEAISKINNLNGRVFCIVYEQNVEYNGKTSFCLFDNRIFIKEGLSSELLTWTYAHECMHKIRYTADERFIQFETFKFLHESGVQYFKEVALWRASKMHKLVKDYDCTYYVVQYLKEKGEML